MKTLRGILVAQTLLATLTAPLMCLAAGSIPDYKIGGPFKSHNLEVFIIHGSDAAKEQHIQTLAEAMKAKTFKVFETGSVNELACQNLSSLPVFIQSGDIVKGGRQDRTMQYDLLVPPKSQKMPLSSFCVESGRWQKRGRESDAEFSSSTKSLSGKEMKLAAKYSADQGAVWQTVAKQVGDLAKHSQKVAYDAAAASPTSLQMTVENKGVEKSIATYTNDLKGLAAQDKDAIGYAFSIDGKMNSADVYASHDLFVKLWPKLLDATAVEAVAVNSPTPSSLKPKAVGVGDVRSLLHSNDLSKASMKKISDDTSQETRDSAKAVYFETKTRDNNWLHKNYIVK